MKDLVFVANGDEHYSVGLSESRDERNPTNAIIQKRVAEGDEHRIVPLMFVTFGDGSDFVLYVGLRSSKPSLNPTL